MMLQELSEQGLLTQDSVLKMIGKRFRIKLTELPPWYTDVQVANSLLRYSLKLYTASYLLKHIAINYGTVVLNKALFAC